MMVSVIVPAYNAQATIKNVLEALIQQDYPHILEIIVVDDGSCDQTAAIIKSFSQVKYLFQKNAGPASARNYGAGVARGDVLAFTDSDCIAHVDWISRLIKGFHSNDIGVVMGSYGIANPQSMLASCVHHEIEFRHRYLLPDYPKAFGSYNFCIRKEIFHRVGGFNTSYRQASGEDNDLSYKVLGTGRRIYFERKALVNHHHPTRLYQYLKEQYRHGLWRVKMYINHPFMLKGDDYTFWKDVLEIPLSFVCLIALGLALAGIWKIELVLIFLFLPFIIFEIIFAQLMVIHLVKDFFWGFTMFLRSFSRFFGLSTGILIFSFQKFLNKY